MKADGKERHYRFFQNRACEFFPCHDGIAEEEFNCLFCFCPLYALGRDCGGECRYSDSGLKDCSDCAWPHDRRNYAKIMDRYREIMDVVRRVDEMREAEQRREDKE